MARNYSTQDFSDVLEEIFSIVEASTDRWSPRTSTEADPGVIILKIIALFEDKFNFKLNMAEAQAYLDSVSDRQYAFDVLNMFGYIMKNARSSTGMIGISLAEALEDEEPIVIPAFTSITNASKAVKFFTTRKHVIMPSELAGDAEIYIAVQEGVPREIHKDGVPYFSLKDIDENGRLYLGRSGLAQNGIFISTMSGSESFDSDWERIDFSLLPLKGKKFLVETDENEEMYVQFSADFEAVIGSSTFKVWGTPTRGAAGNITRRTLSMIDDPNLRETFVLHQDVDFYTGSDSESIQQAVAQYYKTKDICNTIVSASDFATAIELLVSPRLRRLYSTVFVDTALTRQKRLVRRWYNRKFLEIVPDASTPTNQIDILPLSYGEDYPATFVKADLAAILEGSTHLNYIRAQLTNTRCLGAHLVPANFDRYLATVKPRIIIRVSDFSMASVSTLKTRIKNYFYSVYRAENLVVGMPLNHQRIVDDIRALSPSIQSVTMSELAYQIYKERIVNNGVISFTKLSDEDKQNIVAQSIREGEIPAFKFYNRPNLASKVSATYMHGSPDVFNPIPWGTLSNFVPLNATGDPVQPVVTELIVSRAFTHQEAAESGYKQIELNENHLLQFRKKLYRTVEEYGFGLNFTFVSPNNPPVATNRTVINYARLLSGTMLKGGDTPIGNPELVGVAVIVPTRDYPIAADFSCWVKEEGTWVALTVDNAVVLTGGDWKLEQGKQYALDEDLIVPPGITLALDANSILLADSEIAPMSIIDGAPFSAHTIQENEEYLLKAGETLTIKRTSNGDTVAELGVDDRVLLKGLSIPNVGSSSAPGQVLQPTQTICKLGNDESIVSTNFSYLLSLNTTEESIVLPPEGRMLEEGEAFVYADRNITEYIMLGPGTILIPPSGVSKSLLVHPITNIQELNADLFKDVPFEIKAQACELTTYQLPRRVVHNISDIGDEGRFPTVWTDMASGEYEASVFTGEGTDSLIKKYSGEYSVRLVAKIETDDNGVAEIKAPISFKLTAGDDSLTITGETDFSACLLSSVPFVSVITNSDSSAAAAPTLLPVGMAASFNKVGISLDTTVPTGIDYKQFANRLVITIDQASEEERELNLPYTMGNHFMFTGDAAVLTSSQIKFILATATVEYGSTITNENDYIKLGGVCSFVPSEVLPNPEEEEIVLTNSIRGGVTLSLPIEDAEATTKNITVTIPPGTPVGTKLIINELSYVTGFADEVLHVKDNRGDLIDSDAPDYFNPIIGNRDEPDEFLESITTAAEPIDWLALPNEELANPTNSQNYFSPVHPVNKRVLPFIELDMQEIKVVRSS